MKASIIPIAGLLFLLTTPGARCETVVAGKTKTAAPGSKAKVTSRIQGNKTILNFVIPRGKSGSQGAQGPQGPPGPAGPAGPAASAASKARSIIIPGNALSYTGSGVTGGQWGPGLSSTATATPACVIPRPADWDETTAPSVTIHFSVATTGATDSTVRWRMRAGSNAVNSVAANASTGWDSLEYSQALDASPLLVPVATPYTHVSKSQTWTALRSSPSAPWYFGTGVTTNNNFTNSPVWHFSFQRGSAAGNGESFTGSLTINAISIDYTAK